MSNIISFNNTRPGRDTPADVNSASFKLKTNYPVIEPSTIVHSLATVTGNVELGARVIVAPGASIRGYENQTVWVGNDTKIQDGAVLHALQTLDRPDFLEEAVVEVEGKFYGAYIGDRVHLTHQSQVHGPASVGSNTFVGMQSLIFQAIVGENCIIEPKALVMGVEVGDGRYVPAGALITTQAAANELPFVDRDYLFKNFNRVGVGTGSQSKPNFQPRQKPNIAS